MEISVESTEWLFSPLFPGQSGSWKCWFLWREENHSTRENTLGAGPRDENQQQQQNKLINQSINSCTCAEM